MKKLTCILVSIALLILVSILTKIFMPGPAARTDKPAITTTVTGSTDTPAITTDYTGPADKPAITTDVIADEPLPGHKRVAVTDTSTPHAPVVADIRDFIPGITGLPKNFKEWNPETITIVNPYAFPNRRGDMNNLEFTMRPLDKVSDKLTAQTGRNPNLQFSALHKVANENYMELTLVVPGQPNTIYWVKANGETSVTFQQPVSCGIDRLADNQPHDH